VLASHAFSSARRVSIYVSAEGEVNTSAIIERALHDNKVCFVPRFTPKALDMEMVRLGSIHEFRNLPIIMWGIRQPPIDLQLENALDTGNRSRCTFHL
jgi:5-formyltetrahydrofolate cyclo-ligase